MIHRAQNGYGDWAVVKNGDKISHIWHTNHGMLHSKLMPLLYFGYPRPSEISFTKPGDGSPVCQDCARQAVKLGIIK
jgi:hypothetical protein